MLTGFQINYNEKRDTLDIIKTHQNGRKIAYSEEGKYGVVVHYDIIGTPRCITIPEISTLFGISKEDLMKFASFFR